MNVDRLERAKATDTSEQTDIPPKHNHSYGRITNREVKEALKGIKRNTDSGPDKCRLKDIKDLSTEEISAIFNKCWGVLIFQRKQLSVEPSYHQNR